ncbi:MAG TPA: aminotransferase class V-fold PLP-dependent enzyme [Ktedonobacterales bacterium]
METPSPYRAALERALAYSLNHLDSLDSTPVAATATLEELRARLTRPLADDGMDAGQVLDELAADTAGGINGSAGGRFFGWVIGGSVPAALAADWLTAVWDQNAAAYACAPAETVIEEVAGAWLKDLLGLPPSASVAFVTGSQMAHATALAAARHALLERDYWNVEQRGLMGAPAIRILTSNQRHGSIERAVRLLGLGSDNLIELPVDEQGRLQPDTLSSALQAAAHQPVIVVLQAGDLNIGAFDPFAELIPLAHAAGAWVHVDGAFGLWASTSRKYCHLLKGVAEADSWATDGHKWLNVPYDSGYAFVAHPEPHRSAMTYTASYVSRSTQIREPADWNPEWSRRGRGVATYAAIRQLGRRGIADLIERTCHHAHTLVTHIGALEGAEIVWEPQINQGLVRFLNTTPGAADVDHDRRTDKVIAAILRSGEAFFTGTTWRGKRCMRVSVCNWQTSERDVARAIAAVRSALQT